MTKLLTIFLTMTNKVKCFSLPIQVFDKNFLTSIIKMYRKGAQIVLSTATPCTKELLFYKMTFFFVIKRTPWVNFNFGF